MKCQIELEFPAIIFFIYFYLYILNHLKAEKKIGGPSAFSHGKVWLNIVVISFNRSSFISGPVHST